MWTQGLNPEQVSAVNHNHGPLLILAGAGSGKTTVLVSRTGRLIDEQIAAAEEILVLTFTNKAARELKHRVSVKLGARAKGLWTGTFHSFGLSLLRQFHKEARLPRYFGVMDQTDSQALLREILRSIKIAGKDKFDLQHLLELVNQLRILGRQKQEAFDEYHELAQMILPHYLKKMDLRGAVDFEGLLLRPLQLMQEHPEIQEQIQARFEQIMVDEFQDTNAVQMRLIKAILSPARNITVVGDDDQSIYGWRGAEVKNILDFPKLFKPCEVIRLERNYRSSPAILQVANEVIQKNKQRHGKVLKAEGRKNNGELPEVFVLDNENDEVDFVQREVQMLLQSGRRHEDIAILYRSNAQGALVETIFREHRIPYTVSGGTAFFDRKEIKDIISLLRFAIQPNEVSLRRMINTPPRGIGDTSIEKLSQFSQDQKISFLKACLSWRDAGVGEKVGQAIDSFFAWEKALVGKLVDTQQSGANLLQELREIGYRDYVYQTSSSGEAADKKWQLVEVFSRILDSFMQKGQGSIKALREFVDAMELRDSQEDEEADRKKISLMTLHAAKGLEFPIVFLLGVEEDLLPHKTLGGNIDEERRLFYVGVTRAKEKLLLTRCRQRTRNGQARPVSVSRFLLEIPHAFLRTYENGFRPVSGEQREKLVSDFLAKLEKR